jgi:hypothetical protein
MADMAEIRRDDSSAFQRLCDETTNPRPELRACFRERLHDLLGRILITNLDRPLTERDDLPLTNRKITPASGNLAVQGKFSVLHLFLESREAGRTKRIV